MPKLFLIPGAALLLTACAVPVPMEKSAFVGEWRAPGMYLLIMQDGSVAYKRLKGGGSISIEGPLRGFEGDNAIVGIWPIKKTFVVSVPPHQDAGRWKMTVDGVELTR